MAAALFARAADPAPVFLSDLARANLLTVRQGWGTLGLDTAAVPPDGRKPTPIRLGEKTCARGLGHHAPGEIVVPLDGRYVRFQAEAGVQWQGGGRGSTVFEVRVDGAKRFETGPRADSDPPVVIDLPLAGAQELRLVAGDHGDGIGCDMATWADARLIPDTDTPAIGPVALDLGRGKTTHSSASCGFSVIAAADGPQAAVLAPAGELVVCVRRGETAEAAWPVTSARPLTLRIEAALASGARADVSLDCGSMHAEAVLDSPDAKIMELTLPALPSGAVVRARAEGRRGEAAVRWRGARLSDDRGRAWPLSPCPPAPPVAAKEVPRTMPVLRPALERELVEWDWRMQDGIGTARRPVGWREAAARTLDRGLRGLSELRKRGAGTAAADAEGAHLRERLDRAAAGDEASDRALWRDVHAWRRGWLVGLGWPDGAPIAFVKQAPGVFSHQLTQYYGSGAKPGGGLCVLDAPGRSLACRTLADGALPPGSYQHLDVSADGARLLFAYCRADTVPPDRSARPDRVFHVYETAARGGARPRQLTDGPFDDFCPRYLPDGRLLFLSTRRGGYHRCGRGPCPVYTLTLAGANGANPRTISYHETHEWDPAVMADGRIVYTRWDYVDRSAVHYQQLWSARPDGSDVRALYGNHTLNPVGVWEARAVPGSRRLMATAAAHHAMTAGSIILVDPAAGYDGLEPITRLTPDALFPESEAPVAPPPWRAPAGVESPPAVPEEAERWPGHCYRSPWPLSETLFLAAYSFDPLIGEPSECPANMFGLYLADAFGNKELLHRDLNISSQWPIPLRARAPAPELPSPSVAPVAAAKEAEGLFVMADVRAAWPPLPSGAAIRSLRIVQVLPKTTPHANDPPVGLANASPGKQVLGTVPVEADGSAFFRAPAGVALHFQALDELGRAVQTMRSVAYLQPGETTGCAGCHEPRTQAPAAGRPLLALRRAPSRIEPGPDGSRPLSFPLLVQPVLDRRCVRCHSGGKPGGGVALTAEPEGAFTRAYAALAKRVPFSAWASGNFRETNGEPLTHPDRFGSRASPLMKKLLAGHHDVVLDADDRARLTTWMDANALFYGTFDPADQARQRRGERLPPERIAQ